MLYWVFQNDEVVVHVVRRSRGAGVVAEVLGGHRPALWVSDLYGAQQGHASAWQICLARQLRDCTYAIDAGAVRANYGFSPGDDDHPEPYLYVGRWEPAALEVAPLSELSDPLAWLRERHAALHAT